MKKINKIISKIIMIFAMALIFGVSTYTNVYAATVGQPLTSPETGWQRFKYTDNRIQYIGTGWYDNYGADFVCPVIKAPKAEFRFYGTELRVMAYANSNRATKVNVVIDGIQVGTFNESTGSSFNTLMFEKTGLTLGSHIVELNCTGSAGDYLSLSAIDIDSNGKLETYDPKISITNIVLDKNIDNLQVGQNDTLTPTITPSNATNKNIFWTSSNTTIVTVDNGVITGHNPGTVTITATTQDGSNLSASCTVNVLPAIPQGTINLTANTTNQAISLNWNSVNGATGYNVKRSTTQGSGYTNIASNITDVNYTDSGVTPGVTYYYVVTPVNSAGEGIPSNEATATVANTAPKVVLNIEPEKTKIKTTETVSANLVIDNIKEIAAEDIRITYWCIKSNSSK